MIKHENSGQTFLLVELPERAENFELAKGQYDYECCLEIYYDNDFSIWGKIGMMKRITLDAPGSWQIICKASEATEAQAKEIVESRKIKKSWDDRLSLVYCNYINHDWHDKYMDTALESLHSLLRSHNLQPETTIILKEIK